MQAAARLEAAVERLAQAVQARLSQPPDATETDTPEAEPSDMVPRAEVAALADRLEATIARLRAVLPEEPGPDTRPGAS